MLDLSDRYSVRSVYQKLTSLEFLSFDATSDFIWHKQVPLKVSIMAWRLLRNRLLKKDNLVARDIISHDNQLCMTRCGGIEIAYHLLLSCPCFHLLWSLVRAWIGISSADPYHLQDHVKKRMKEKKKTWEMEDYEYLNRTTASMPTTQPDRFSIARNLIQEIVIITQSLQLTSVWEMEDIRSKNEHMVVVFGHMKVSWGLNACCG